MRHHTRWDDPHDDVEVETLDMPDEAGFALRPGDRVRSKRDGELGTIVLDEGSAFIKVDWDDGRHGAFIAADALEVITPA